MARLNRTEVAATPPLQYATTCCSGATPAVEKTCASSSLLRNVPVAGSISSSRGILSAPGIWPGRGAPRTILPLYCPVSRASIKFTPSLPRSASTFCAVARNCGCTCGVKVTGAYAGMLVSNAELAEYLRKTLRGRDLGLHLVVGIDNVAAPVDVERPRNMPPLVLRTRADILRILDAIMLDSAHIAAHIDDAQVRIIYMFG